MGGPVFVDPNQHTIISNNQVTVASAGTRVQLSSVSTGIHTVVIKALAANSGKIYVGNSAVSSSNGFELSAGEGITITVNNLNIVYIDAGTSGDKVCYVAS